MVELADPSTSHGLSCRFNAGRSQNNGEFRGYEIQSSLDKFELYFRLGQCHFEHGRIINRWFMELWKLRGQSIGLLPPTHCLVGPEQFELCNSSWSCCR